MLSSMKPDDGRCLYRENTDHVSKGLERLCGFRAPAASNIAIGPRFTSYNLS
jgi:hypothetical protein